MDGVQHESRRSRQQRLETPIDVNPAGGDQSKVMTIAEVADYLNCHYGTICRLLRGGDLSAFRLGGSRRFLRSDLDKWIASRTSGAVEKGRESEPQAGKVQDRARRRKRK